MVEKDGRKRKIDINMKKGTNRAKKGSGNNEERGETNSSFETGSTYPGESEVNGTYEGGLIFRDNNNLWSVAMTAKWNRGTCC